MQPVKLKSPGEVFGVEQQNDGFRSAPALKLDSHGNPIINLSRRSGQSFGYLKSCLKKAKSGIPHLFGNVIEDSRTTSREDWNSYVSHLEAQVKHMEQQLLSPTELSNVRLYKGTPSCPSTLETTTLATTTSRRTLSTNGTALSYEDPFSDTYEYLNSNKLSVVHGGSNPYISKANRVSDPNTPGQIKYSGPEFANTLFSSMRMEVPKFSMYEESKVDTISASKRVLPPKPITERLLSVYFALVNSQYPILHREQFLVEHFEPIYGKLSPGISLANDSDVFSGNQDGEHPEFDYMPTPTHSRQSSPVVEGLAPKASAYNNSSPSLYSHDTLRTTEHNRVSLFFLNMCIAIALCYRNDDFPTETPHAYYEAAMRHAEVAIDNNRDRVQALQASLIIVMYGTLRPIQDGVFRMLRECIQMVYELKLHIDTTELSAGSVIIDSRLAVRNTGTNAQFSPPPSCPSSRPSSPSGRIRDSFPLGKARESTFEAMSQVSLPDYTPLGIDMRRRLFWTAYCLDKLLLGPYNRDFEIPTGLCASVPFPSAADDKYLTYERVFVRDPDVIRGRCYKTVSHAMFSIRVMQAKIRDTLFVEKSVPLGFNSWDHWQKDMNDKLEEWYHTCPQSSMRSNCHFNFLMFRTQYAQTKMMIYAVPLELLDHFEPRVLEKLADAAVLSMRCLLESPQCDITDGNSIIGIKRIYLTAVNYVYAIFNSPDARRRTSINDVNWMGNSVVKLLSNFSVSHHCANSYIRALFQLFKITVDMFREELEEVRH